MSSSKVVSRENIRLCLSYCFIQLNYVTLACVMWLVGEGAEVRSEKGSEVEVETGRGEDEVYRSSKKLKSSSCVIYLSDISWHYLCCVMFISHKDSHGSSRSDKDRGRDERDDRDDHRSRGRDDRDRRDRRHGDDKRDRRDDRSKYSPDRGDRRELGRRSSEHYSARKSLSKSPVRLVCHMA